MDPLRAKGARRQSAPSEAFSRAREQRGNSCVSKTTETPSNKKANHGLDHVDDRPRARADGGA